MKTPIQLAASLVALGGLLSGPAAMATDVAELPLKASVLAKPNVIFGMDDSGSMDWEILLDTSSGLLWWNGSTAWDSSTGKPLRSASYVPYAYLFPVGTNTGGQIYAYNSYYGQAVPPTPQFAWLRSKAYNPIYYDTHTTYKPWSPAYVDNDGDSIDDGSIVNYSNASTSATLSHPLYPSGPKLAADSVWTSANPLFDDNGNMFYVQAGMKVPVGSRILATSASSGACKPVSGSGKSAVWVWQTLTTELTVDSGAACWASIPYRPATFWEPETCTVDGSTCVNAPDGTKTLKRYEIKTGATFPSGRSVNDELQNFANWFTYYRKRKLMLAGSMGQVLEDLTGLRLGVVPFNNHWTVDMVDTDASAANKNALKVTGLFYTNGMSANGTPTHATVKHIGSQYDSNKSIVQYACQRNNMFVVTDGFSNTTSISVPSYNASTFGAGPPYATTPTGSLADLALSYYTNRLRTDLAAGKVPASSSDAPNADKNTNLHVNTYAISLGVRGSLWPNSVDPFETAPTWTTPVADDPSMIDDQWHATINGRGLMFLATNPTETANSIQSILNDIISQTGAQGGVAVSSVNLSRGDNRAYFGTYDPAGWKGDLRAYPIDAETGKVDQRSALWSAAEQLEQADRWTTRVIATASGGSGLEFTAAAVGSIVNPGGIYGSDADVIDYLRGDRSKEGTVFRKRLSLMGAVINSEPAVQRAQNVVYVQSGEGMLHAIDTAAATGGRELWAFVPPGALPHIGATVERGYVFRTQLDGSPTVGPYAGGTLLVAGMGAAGRSFYALDVSSPRGLTQAQLKDKFKWQFPSASDATTAAKVGQALGRPRIVKAAGGSYVVLVTSGYNSTADGRGRMWMLDAANGEILHEFDTGAGTLGAEAGLAHVSGYLEDDGTVRYVYGGDLLGNLWRFDLKDKGTPTRVATLKDGGGTAQPVTAPPELVEIDGKRVVIVGTGRILDITDFGGSPQHSVYAIADGTELTNPRASLVEQTLEADASKVKPVDWATKRGWYVDLPTGEHANTQPAAAYGTVGFAANKAGGNDCSASSKLYVLNIRTGGYDEETGYISTTISDVAMASRVTAVVTTGTPSTDPDTPKSECTGGGVAFIGQDADGNSNCGKGNPGARIDPAKNSWREIRRQ
ncbi:MAG: PilC/PilY family type IV pilus protein [Rubrivivax sp.]